MIARAGSTKRKLGREEEVFRGSMKRLPVDWEAILARIPGVKTVIVCRAGRDIFRQGQTADSVFYLRRGKVRISVISRRGREAVVCTLETGDFFGEGCLVGQDLVHHLFNSSEKRLARILIMLAHFGKESRSETLVTNINQENLAKMVGTTRSQISSFLNKFEKLGFVDYNGGMNLTVNDSLISVLLSD
jgi:CRP-like cAMP-binding protein